MIIIIIDIINLFLKLSERNLLYLTIIFSKSDKDRLNLGIILIDSL